MKAISAKIRVGADHRISGAVPDKVPSGEHEIIIAVSPLPSRQKPNRLLSFECWPSHDMAVAWGGLSLRRQGIYGDDER
jgi:hypothetical protein